MSDNRPTAEAPVHAETASSTADRTPVEMSPYSSASSLTAEIPPISSEAFAVAGSSAGANPQDAYRSVPLSVNPSASMESLPLSSTTTSSNQSSSTLPGGDHALSSPSAGKVSKNDAYLFIELVRTTFSSKPIIYNTFLEIMKEFKAQTISTQEVVARVRTLFHGYPRLIEGFDAFLPRGPRPGEATAKSPSYIATMPPLPPAQKMLQSMNQPTRYYDYGAGQGSNFSKTNLASTLTNKAFSPINMQSQVPGMSQSGVNYTSGFPGVNIGATVPGSGAMANALPSHMVSTLSGGVNVPMNSSLYVQQPASPAGGLNAPLDMSASSQMYQKRPSIGTNQAVNYLRKIQQRFDRQPDIYTTFVEILRAYQKHERDLKDVKEQVSTLFAGHADLLDEFGQFIPESEMKSMDKSAELGRRTMMKPGPAAPYPPNMAMNRKTAQQMVQETLRSGRYGGAKRAATVFGGSPAEPPKRTKLGNERSCEELEFFEKVKSHLSHNEQLYGEFLKCLNWYTLDILKKKELVKLVHGFIGRSEELFSWFKDFVGYADKDDDENISKKKAEEAGPVDAYSVDLLSCKRLGSYRFLPKNYEYSVCSGRSSLCHEVLNDNLVSCPSFTSEDSTFVSSKKNQYEEALFRCEDERYELDLLIDGNQATIANFEPLLKKMALMPPKEAEKFTLTDSLGGHSEVIYRNIIRKVYGVKSDEVLDALKKQPSVAVPVVLKRLKQKDEEWRMAQRDWNRVWREIHFKNYYKALDHQGLSFKTSDKKLLASKNLVNEIQTIYLECQRATSNNCVTHTPTMFAASLPSSQGLDNLKSDSHATETSHQRPESSTPECLLSFEFRDLEVLESVLQLLIHQVYKSTQFGSLEKKAIEKFLLNFLSDFFPIVVIKKEAEKSISTQNRLGGDPVETSGAEDDDEEFASYGVSSRDVSAARPSFKLAPSHPDTPSNYIMANEPLYVFFRLFQVAYHRLLEMKQAAVSFQETPLFFHKRNYIASFLELQKKPFSDLNPDSNFFLLLVEMLRGLLDGSFDQSVFEERARLMFGANAYLIFTYDRLLYSILRQCSFILSDAPTEHIVALYDSWKRPRPTLPKPLDADSYLIALKALLSAEGSPSHASVDIYSVRSDFSKDPGEFGVCIGFGFVSHARLANASSTMIASQNSSKEQESAGESAQEDGDWKRPYLESFVSAHTNPDIMNSKPPLFLVSYLKDIDEKRRLEDMTIDYQLECKVCLDNCRLAFKENTEDFIYKPVASDKEEAADSKESGSAVPSKCVERFHAWLDSRVEELNQSSKGLSREDEAIDSAGTSS